LPISLAPSIGIRIFMASARLTPVGRAIAPSGIASTSPCRPRWRADDRPLRDHDGRAHRLQGRPR
jgi:hypothetical protein